MEMNLKQKPTLTNVAWELQRRVYVQTEGVLNPEFARFKSLGSASLPSNGEVDYTLSATSEPREVIHLPRGYHHLRVYTGSAWVTYNAKDHFLKPGDEMRFDRDSQSAVVSCIGKETLNFQINQ